MRYLCGVHKVNAYVEDRVCI